MFQLIAIHCCSVERSICKTENLLLTTRRSCLNYLFLEELQLESITSNLFAVMMIINILIYRLNYSCSNEKLSLEFRRHLLFTWAIKHTFLWVYWHNKPRGMLGEHDKSLQAFQKFSQYSKWFTIVVNP